MTKQELREKLENSFKSLGNLEGAEESNLGYAKRIKEGVFWYILAVYEVCGDVLTRRKIQFYCVAKGKLPKEQMGNLDWNDLPEGEYYFCNEDLRTTTLPKKNDTSFKDEVEEALAKKITENGLIKGFIESYSNENRSAIIKGFKLENGEVSEKKFFVCDIDGSLQINPLKY